MHGTDKTEAYMVVAKRSINDYWTIYGRTHTNTDFVAENGCRVLSNQLGYPIEHQTNGFRSDLIVEV